MRNPHGRVSEVAGLEELTQHGLRCSFKSRSEWVETPVGDVAQLMGQAECHGDMALHRPSLDLLAALTRRQDEEDRTLQLL
jgi:hypothetical protein